MPWWYVWRVWHRIGGMEYERTLSPVELAGALGVSVMTVTRWKQAGCPHEETKPNWSGGCASRPKYNAEEVREWLKERKAEKEVSA